MDKIKVFALGGLDENGKNLQIVEINEKIFVIECGVLFPDKTTPGIDYIIANYDYLVENKNRVKAYILLHGHDDEVGALAYMYKDVPAPIYCSNATKANLIKFTKHVDKMDNMYDFVIIQPSSTFVISGITFNFFHTCHNIADSSGVAIETSYGNIIYPGDYIIENNAEETYLCDLKTIGKIAEKPTLLLMCESGYADKLGYTAPKHKLAPLVFKDFEEARGRIFVSLFTPNNYNIGEVFQLARDYNRKIVCYDKETMEVLDTFLATSGTNFPRSGIIPIDDVNRVPEAGVLILMCAYGARLYRKMSRLASGLSEEKRIQLKPTDLFVMAAPPHLDDEIIATDAVNELYKTGAHIRNIKSKEFYSMHASEEDIKMMISLLKPRYYMPVKGSFRQLLANATLAVKMGVKLNYNNVFILDNGNVLSIDEHGAHVEPTNVKTGNLLIDGFGIADSNNTRAMDERTNLSQDGVVILACTVSKKERKIVAGPDIQMRGFIFLKDNDAIQQELTRILVSTTEEYLDKPYSSFDEARQIIYENALRTIRKETGKSPVVLPLILFID